MTALTLLLVASLAVLGSAVAGNDDVDNKFYVTFSIVPDPLRYFSFHTLPRTSSEAFAVDEFNPAKATLQDDNTYVYCRKLDHRVCLLFDRSGSIAGIQVSAAVEEIEKANLPINLDNDEFWFRTTLCDVDVYSTKVYFVSEELLANGGRDMDDDTPTAPDGIYILSKSGRIHVPKAQAGAEGVGFDKQGCFRGMGRHYFQGLTKTSTCENHQPFFLLFNPKSEQMHGFGLAAFGKVSQGREGINGWFETPPAVVVGMIAPNSPPCLQQWVNQYGLFTIHVFFNDKPWNVRC